MISKLAIEKAVEGGWFREWADQVPWQSIALDPEFWQALGKSLGWKSDLAWLHEGQRFCSLVLVGGNIEAFWNELLN